jgi:hypothetical protein
MMCFRKSSFAGTVNPDKFVITKTANTVNVKQYKLDKNKENPELVFEKTYDDSKTKELWIYGLEDDDIYEVSGDGRPKMNIRLIGGYNHDTYNVANGSKVKIYDFKSQKNTYNTKVQQKIFPTITTSIPTTTNIRNTIFCRISECRLQSG